MKKLYMVLLVFCIALIIAGCSSKNDGPVTAANGYDQYIENGNAKFLAQDYTASLDNFQNALKLSSYYAEPYIGIGWCSIRLNKIAAAKQIFNEGLQKFPQNGDLLAGLGVVYNIEKDFMRSNQKIDLALTITPAWLLGLDNRIDRHVLYVLRAQNYFQLGNFSSSFAAIKLINPAFSIDYSTSDVKYQVLLGEEIERLSKIYIF